MGKGGPHRCLFASSQTDCVGESTKYPDLARHSFNLRSLGSEEWNSL